MSSIIKSGSAPSNTPDGKYFLQTDQACSAELKRGRTYICTAQEEAKVSHYVIITNADFTVTFNGDSDLVQVGVKNNAIYMNVHRACRMDFAQGGNLVFKAGTVDDFDSRITMGVNASGNVLVADSLPQQGDFAGQICSVTSGATYVWTGSTWASTAGISTLPNPGPTGTGLHSNGTAWVTDNANRDKFSPFPSMPSASADQLVYYKVAYQHAPKAVGHYGFDVRMGFHSNESHLFHIDITTKGPSASEYLTQAQVAVTFIPSFHVNADMFGLDWWKSRVTFVFSPTSHFIYMVIKKYSTSNIGGTLFNGVDADSGNILCYSSLTATTTPSETDLTDCTTAWFTVPPASTAANQMLVSDGNGGWKTALHPTRTIQALTDGAWVTGGWTKYAYKKIASHPTTVGHTAGQLSIDYTFGVHGYQSYNGKLKITIVANGTSNTSGMTVLQYPSYLLDSTHTVIDTTRYLSCDVALNIGLVYNSSSSSVDVYFIAKSTGAHALNYVPRFTFDNIIGDEDWTYSTTSVWDAEQEQSLPSELILGSTSVYMVPPATTTADNGKVLKVVNGVPTWASA